MVTFLIHFLKYFFNISLSYLYILPYISLNILVMGQFVNGWIKDVKDGVITCQM